MLPIDLIGVLLLWIAGVATWDTGMVAASAVSRGAQATAPAAGVEERGQGCPCCVWGCRLCRATALGEGSELWMPPYLKEWSHRALCHCSLLSVMVRATAARRLESHGRRLCCCPLPLGCGSATATNSWNSRRCLHIPLGCFPCVTVSPP